MELMKKIGQCIAAPAYALVYACIVYLVVVFPLAFIIALPSWLAILIVITCGTILEALQGLLMSFLLIPFAWILRRNKVALVLAILSFVLFMGRAIWLLWVGLWDNGATAIVLAALATAFLLSVIYKTIIALMATYGASSQD